MDEKPKTEQRVYHGFILPDWLVERVWEEADAQGVSDDEVLAWALKIYFTIQEECLKGNWIVVSSEKGNKLLEAL